jgi:hypothetical protein
VKQPERRPKAYSTWLVGIIALMLSSAASLPAWTMSVEFPYDGIPRPLWERDLAHLKEMGVAHISLPPSVNTATDATQLDDVIRIIRRLGLEADLEGPIPDRLQALAKSHGGPLTEALADAVHITATMPRALDNERKLLASGTQAIVWTDVFETLDSENGKPAYRPGAITLAGTEGPGAALVRREAQLARFWGPHLSGLPEAPGARLAVPLEGVSVHQYIAEKSGSTILSVAPAGLSLAAVINDSPDTWTGEVRVLYPALQRPIALPTVTVAAYNVLWLPVNVPLTAGPLCSGCAGFAPTDHLAYATAELTGMEYENGVLAMEFIAPTAGEVVLQFSHEPAGPLIAAGHPVVFDWDAKTQRARLPIPAGNVRTGRVRVALAIDAPPATALFDNASVLLVGETTHLTAQFSPPAVAARSRLRAPADLTVVQEEDTPHPAPKDAANLQPAPPPLEDKDRPAVMTYKVSVPATAVAGDTALLAIEADGMQLSHSQLRVLAPAAFTFDDAVTVRIAAGSSVSLSPATIPVNQKPGREIVISLRNNAPEIRTFDVAIRVPGLEFSPEKLTISVGASVARDVTFRVFSSSATPGVHDGEVRLSGAASLVESVRFVVLPPAGAIAWTAEGFSILESAKSRASFLSNRWLEMIDKDSGNDLQPAGGTLFKGGPVESLHIEDLEKLAAPKPNH